MFWARRRPERTSLTNERVQTTDAESQGTAKRNADEKVPKEGSADCSEKKYITAQSRHEKMQWSNRKHIEALSKLEKKVRSRKKNENVLSCGADVGSFPDVRKNSLHGVPGPPLMMAVSSVHENNIEEKQAPSRSLVNQPSYHEHDVHSETNSICSHSSHISTKTLNTLSIETQSTLCAQDLHSVNYTFIEENDIASERQCSGEPCNEKDMADKEVCSDESSYDSNNQRLEESVFPRERINNNLIKVFQCNFCHTYYLYYESYQEHKKKCLTCSKCNLTFPSILELYKHITSKAHKEYFSFLEVYKWTQSQLRLRISRNEVYERDVKKLTLLEVANQEKELSALMTDSGIGNSMSSGDQKQDNIGASSLPCMSACSDDITLVQEKNESLSTSQCVIENKTHPENGGELGLPGHSRETGKSVKENNFEIVHRKKQKNSDCLVGPSDGNINTNITRSVSKEPDNEDTQQNKHCAQMLPQEGKSGKKFKENGNTYKKSSPEEILNSEASKSKNVLSKSSQKIAKDSKSPQNKNNRTTEKVSNGSEPEKICLKVHPLRSGSASMQMDSRIITSKFPNKEDKKSQGKVTQKHQSSSKKLHREQNSSRALKHKNTSKDLLQGTAGSTNSKLGKASLRKTQKVVDKQMVASARSKNCHSSGDLTIIRSSDKENSNSKNVSSSSIQTSSSQGSGHSEKKKSVTTSGQTKRPLEISHSFEQSAPKAIKLLMKTVRVTSDLIVSCKKVDMVPESCPGCSNKVDNTTAVYNTKTNHVSFWCRTCNWDIVFSADA